MQFNYQRSLNDILRVENVKKNYHLGDQIIKALDDVSFSLIKGEILGIMGSSGSGKSTMLKIIGGLETPSEGKIYVNGIYEKNYSKEPFASEFRRRNIGFVFQEFNLLEDITIEENVSLPLLLQKCKDDYIDQNVNEKLELVGLKQRKKSNPKELSGGQRQRVALARALIGQPNILLADEPTGNLDYNTSKEVMELIKKMNQELGQSTIIVTHDPMVASYANRVIFFHDGKIQSEYRIEDGKDNISEILSIFQAKYHMQG